MYTWEIKELLNLKNYILNKDEYLTIIDTSPQIKKIKYNAFEDMIEMWTKEDNHTINYFKYKVKRREK